jgi:co-chaperonin GroES (HSP10)
MVNLRPLKEQYVVSRVKETESKIGSFYIPDQAQEKPFEGIVEAIPVIGEPQVVKGDRVLFGK